MTSLERETIAFIGTGVMGGAMAGRLLTAGHPLRVFNRTREKAVPLLERGAVWCDSPAEAAREARIAISMVGHPEDVAAVLLGPEGVLSVFHAGGLVIDMTTSSPRLARTIWEAARARGVGALDAPVSGGDVGALQGSLSIMVGGEVGDFERALPILRRMGTNVVRQGGAGAGQMTKLCNQVALASTIVGVCEAMALCVRAGLHPETVLSSIEHGAAGSVQLSRLGPRMVANDFAAGFYVKHFVKDLGLALAAAKELDLELPGADLARRLYDRLMAQGAGDEGIQALFKLWSPAHHDARPDGRWPG